jgi:hypothetical protein
MKDLGIEFKGVGIDRPCRSQRTSFLGELSLVPSSALSLSLPFPGTIIGWPISTMVENGVDQDVHKRYGDSILQHLVHCVYGTNIPEQLMEEFMHYPSTP